nr:SusC/RagA family TonB-linked outer membrane protein [Pedobacter sp.]
KPGDIKFSDLNGDGLISDNDREIIGDPTPDFTYGLTLSANYKGFDMVVLGQGIAGNQIFNAIRRFDLPTANYTTDILNRWVGEGTSNVTPRLTLQDDNKNYSRVSSLFIEDGSYFRIKTLQIGYTLPISFVKKAGLNKVRFYAMANNLVTFTKYTGYDPEIGGGSYGVDRGFYPQARTFFAGINVGF